MPTPWLESIRKKKQLTVFNKATSWAVPVSKAIKAFNHLSLGVKMVSVKEEKAANIVLILANKAGDQYNYDNINYGAIKVRTRPDFKADSLHGQNSTLADPDLKSIFFSVIFLPGKLENATNSQKEVVVVHELIHACGMDVHDSIGIMFPQMMKKDGGLIEYLHEKGTKAMPPIRVGSKTRCIMSLLWSEKISEEATKQGFEGACKEN